MNRVTREHPGSHVLARAKLEFFASVRVGHGARALSGAQEYMLLTFATEIGDQLELDAHPSPTKAATSPIGSQCNAT